MRKSLISLAGLILLLFISSCGNDSKEKTREAQLRSLSEEIARLQSEAEKNSSDILKNRIRELEEKLLSKREAQSLSRNNMEILSQSMDGHTSLYPFVGHYKVMVIPVQFSDQAFADPGFFNPDAQGQSLAQDYLFGSHPHSMTQYYRHASYGKLHLSGKVMSPVTVDGRLVDYGEAVTGSSDRNARRLVVDALQKVMAAQPDEAWADYDHWDLQDYDGDKNFYEPDGFIDAVILIYAGKSQAGCQRDFDPDGKRPASADVPPGPRQAATVECFNRIWPHRWSISIPQNDPLYTADGPKIEGQQRPSMNGLKINEELFALDYNMQSEFSDRSTFMHEFGHSLTLPDVYARSGENSVGAWELMASNAGNNAQEFSTYSRLSLGWLSPKIVRQGENTGLYLGHLNFVSQALRENRESAQLSESEERQNGVNQRFSILSRTPEHREAVYRSIIALTEPTVEKVKVADLPKQSGNFSAYSNRFDGGSRSLKVKLTVPQRGDATLSFDALWHIETETNFDGNEEAIRVITDYDLGSVLIDGHDRMTLRTISGDSNADTLAEANPACKVNRVLELRRKRIAGQLSDSEKQELSSKTAICQTPHWVSTSFDLSQKRGQVVEVEIRYVTDAGYTEFGIIIDNLRLGSQKIDFEEAGNRPLEDFTLLDRGQVEVSHNQFYLFEYRDPSARFQENGQELSYNMDQHIATGNQAMFMEHPQGDQGALLENFRMVTTDYQPGVLVWYFNSRFDRNSNSPQFQAGKGYLLVLKSKVDEFPLPGILGRADLFDRNGHYDKTSQVYKDFEAAQNRAFACFSHRDFFTYINGVAPDCQGLRDADLMRTLEFQNRRLIFSREGFNQFLPIARFSQFGVAKPLKEDPSVRTAVSTFRPQSAAAFRPFKVFRADATGNMVLDEALTQSAPAFAPVSRFRDADNALSSHRRFHGDTVVVEKKGLSFEVVSPLNRVLEQYDRQADVQSDAHPFRRPLVKVLFKWESMGSNPHPSSAIVPSLNATMTDPIGASWAGSRSCTVRDLLL